MFNVCVEGVISAIKVPVPPDGGLRHKIEQASRRMTVRTEKALVPLRNVEYWLLHLGDEMFKRRRKGAITADVFKQLADQLARISRRPRNTLSIVRRDSSDVGQYTHGDQQLIGIGIQLPGMPEQVMFE